FQAEDGIRDKLVTGVQTCALPIYAAGLSLADAGTTEIAPLVSRTTRCASDGRSRPCARSAALRSSFVTPWRSMAIFRTWPSRTRSEERRVGKEWVFMWVQVHAEYI